MVLQSNGYFRNGKAFLSKLESRKRLEFRLALKTVVLTMLVFNNFIDCHWSPCYQNYFRFIN
jgi:hypothetical protein